MTEANKRTLDLVWSEMQKLQAEEDFDVQKYEELEGERTAILAQGEVRKRHEAYSQSITPAVITATPKGDSAEDYAFAQYLKTGQKNSDLTFAQTEGSAGAGGYAVPDGARNKLVEVRTAFGGFIEAAENITTTSGEDLHYPTVPTAALATSADIVAEGAASAVGADIVFSEVILGAYRYAATGTGNVPLKVSVELLQDSIFDIESFVMRRLGERIARKEAYDVIRGSGSGEPQGIAYGTAGSVEADPAYSAFLSIYHALDPVYRQNAKWVMSDATAAILEAILDGPSGTSGRPLLMTSTNGISQSPNEYTLLGKPVIIDQAMPTWGADDVIGIALGDWKEAYIVRHVRDVVVIVNPYTSANTGYVEYNAWARMDGRVQNASAYVTGEGV